MKDIFKAQAVQMAEHFKLNHNLVLAICEVESSWDHLAIRFEPGWRHFYQTYQMARANRITESTERVLQSSSIGLMQVMGAVARELGLTENLLVLTQPERALFYGCKKLSLLVKKYDKINDAIAAYNAGVPTLSPNGVYKNQAYVDKVVSKMGVL